MHISLFPVPFYRVHVEDHALIAKNLPLRKIRKMAVHQPPGWNCEILTSLSADPNDDSSQEWTGKFFEVCSQYIEEFLRLTYEVQGGSLTYHPAWINLYKKGSFQEWHHHMDNAMFSFCYFYKMPEHPDSAKLIFRSRNKDLEYNYPPQFRLQQNYYPEPKQNELIIFPSWIEHMVTMHKCDEERITISGNFSFAE